ncbi:AMP-binding protein [Actinomadura rudentiformis]|uniref:AMP-binding protein n=1 Tax=Actinomadura rudentiformis TaxID=359158 RepID=A0A6H9Z889_9ACTN|nr:AMP-binding protein [Actinomadura rudentiformis]KAB2350146.1 AMP-binding protein [Actinomadura rudentiformis]
MAPRLARSHWPADTSHPVLELTPGDVLRQATAAAPGRIALAEAATPGNLPPGNLPPGNASPNNGSTGRTWTYSELLADAHRAATWLNERFAPGERVAVWAPNIPEWVILQYGAAMAGLVLVTANPALRETELEYVLTQSRSVGIAYIDAFRGTDMAAIVDRVRPRRPELREAIHLAGWHAELTKTQPGPLPAVQAGDPAQIQYTSGTTGFPKGALLHHRGLVTNASLVAARAGFPEGGVWATALPLFHTAGCGLSVLGAAVSRGTLVLAQSFQPDLVLQAIQDWRADLYAGVPAMLAGLLAHPGFDTYDLSSCATVMSGGDTVPAPLVQEVERRFGARFSTVYGQTELSPIIAQTSPDDTAQDKCTTTGRPLPQVEVKVADPVTGAVLPVGETGEILARGYQVMVGYFDAPEATAATVTPDGWLHTGDLATMDERGYLTITGRLKDMIIRGGENIYPREIEAALSDHPAVAAALVLGVPDSDWGEQVAAIIKPADPARPPTASQLHDHVRSRLAPHKTPRHWYLAQQFPVNAMGKIQKFALRDRLADLTPLA